MNNIIQKKKKVPTTLSTKLNANLYIQCKLKNTLMSLAESNGKVWKQWSTKSLKKTKFKKNTPYNIQYLVSQVNQYIKKKKINGLSIYFNGTNLGRYNILQNLKPNSFKIKYIIDQTKKPFNGCRQKKVRRR